MTVPDPRPLAISCGEPAGIGTEILAKAYAQLPDGIGAKQRKFFTVDDPARLAHELRRLNAPVSITTIDSPDDAADAYRSGLPVLPADGIALDTDITTPGTPKVETAGLVIKSIEQSVKLALDGKAGGVVTLPMQKKVLADSGFPHPGHTEFLGKLCADTPMPEGFARGPIMMLSGGGLNVVPVTVHMPLAAVPQVLTADMIATVGLVTAQALARDVGVQGPPRLAVSGLNPHAGEGGLLGEDEARVITPAIAMLTKRGVNAFGPVPADTLFHEDARTQYHAALAMYHDQALIPVKTIAFHSAVNISLGLPIVRTSPDHGTALPIAGKGVARPDSLLSALVNADIIAGNRAKFDAARAQS